MPRGPVRSWWTRRLWLGARASGWRVFVPVVAALAGLLFTTSFQTAKGTDLRSDRGLPGLIDTENRAVAAKADQLRALQSEIDGLTKAQAPGDAQVGALTGQIDRLAPAVGAASVEGPVVTVSLDDAHRSVSSLPPGVTADDIVVHQQDVQAVVNALWAGGAEAMMIQDQRVIATSAVRCVGNTLILQGRVYSPPFVVKAMGSPAGLRAALDNDPTVLKYRTWVDYVGLGYDVATTSKATFPPYSGSVAQSLATIQRQE
jgi:uncharacterized protein YlxW (UPF0749 family)